MTDITVYKKKKPIVVLATIGALLYFFYFVSIVTHLEFSITDWLIQIFVFLLFLFGYIVILTELSYKGPYIILSSNGLTCHSKGLSIIPWSDISGFKKGSDENTKRITIFLHNGKKYHSQAKLIYRLFSEPDKFKIIISLSFCNFSTDEVASYLTCYIPEITD